MGETVPYFMLIIALLSLGCDDGGSTGEDPASDAGVVADAAPGADASDADVPADAAPPPRTCDREGVDVAVVRMRGDEAFTEDVEVDVVDRSETIVRLSFDFDLEPGTYDLAEAGFDCGCADCPPCIRTSRLLSPTRFFAVSGQLTVEEFDLSNWRFAGRIDDVVLVETTRTADGEDVEIEDGETWCIAELEIEHGP